MRDERRRTPPRGVPALYDEHGDPAGLDEPITLEQRVASLEGGRRGQKKLVITALIAGLGSFGGVLVWALNAREAAGDEKARLRYIERAVERLELYVFPRPSLRRGDPIDAPWPPAQPTPTPPAPKGISP